MEQLHPIMVKSPKYLITFSVIRDNGTIPDVVNRTHDDSRFDTVLFTPMLLEMYCVN